PDQFGRQIGQPFHAALGGSKLDGHVAAFDVPQFAEPLPEGIDKVSACGHGVRPENSNAGEFCWLLRARRERPRGPRAAGQRDELAPPPPITSSAATSSVGGIVRANAFAVLRLITSSNLVGCITGISAAFSPLRMRPV